jgi:vacuolar iron transporter family protein
MDPTEPALSIPLAEQRVRHETEDPHRRQSPVADVILGAQDGTVNTVGVALGVAGVTSDARIIFVGSMAAAVAEALSMAAVAYTSQRARGELFSSERERERRHVRRLPLVEREEVRGILERGGLSGASLENAVGALTESEDVWIDLMMAHEHGLSAVDRRQALRSALIVGLASLIGSVLPVLPFAALSAENGAIAALLVATVLLFGLGAYKARTTGAHPLRAGVELIAIGWVSAVAAHAIGRLLGAAAAS